MGNSKINMFSLNRCPPDTEIFSKRRKIYSVCVESLSMNVRSAQLAKLGPNCVYLCKLDLNEHLQYLEAKIRKNG